MPSNRFSQWELLVFFFFSDSVKRISRHVLVFKTGCQLWYTLLNSKMIGVASWKIFSTCIHIPVCIVCMHWFVFFLCVCVWIYLVFIEPWFSLLSSIYISLHLLILLSHWIYQERRNTAVPSYFYFNGFIAINIQILSSDWVVCCRCG